MIRTAILMMVLFLGISGGTVYMQWHDYEQSDSQSDEIPLVHMIDIRRTGTVLEITQTVEGTLNPSYEIIIPIGAKHLNYTVGKKQQTLKYGQDGKTSVKTNGQDRLVFQYTIPLPQTKTIWLENWSVVLLAKQPQQFHVQLVDYATRNGMWIAGAPLEERIKKERFTIYSWSQTKLLSFPLYFQPGELPKRVYKHIEVYGRDKADLKPIKGMDTPSITIVRSLWNDRHVSPTLIVVPEKNSLSSIETELRRAYYASYFWPSGAINKWVGDLLTALIFQKQAVTPQAKMAMEQIQKNLTKEEQDIFLSSVLQNKGEMLTPALLDAALSEVHKGTTTYFTELSKTKRPHTLVFTNEGGVYVNNRLLKGVKSILRNGEILLPFTETMRHLGYRVKQSGEAVFIEKDHNNWRFFVNSPVYMQGNDRFGEGSVIIYDINGSLYMSTDMIQRWFSVQVWTNDRDIYVKEAS
ncbi:hypothetical protein [Anoxybacteroides tepidamans]|uniref:hypothetical protein n=1 Tax=Anoxybacteroides tepidamans TaxID=265948 RepID=UPI00047F09E7|nr:hypothetical protein [Anoxybacillus tepidamans]